MDLKDQVVTNKYAIYNGDCIAGMSKLPDKSIGLSIYSPPFASNNATGGLYVYSSHERDLSNCANYEDFFDMYDYTVREIARLTMPGRMSAVHSMVVPNSNSGRDSLTDFPGDIIRLHTQCRDPRCTESPRRRLNGHCGHGLFEFAGEHAIWKEPLAVRLRTMQKNLAHATLIEDSTLCGVASADHLLMFRRKGDNPVPVHHPVGLMEYFGEDPLPADCLSYRGWKGKQTENRYSQNIWRRYASSVWHDIRMDEVVPYRGARESEDEKHVHPLQLDVIARAVIMRSNPGDTVLTPYMGVGSEVYQSVHLGRRAIGFELKPSYYRQAVVTCGLAAEGKKSTEQNAEFDFDAIAVE